MGSDCLGLGLHSWLVTDETVPVLISVLRPLLKESFLKRRANHRGVNWAGMDHSICITSLPNNSSQMSFFLTSKTTKPY